MASSATCGTCAPAALSKNVNSGLRFNAGKAARTASTGNSCDCPDGLWLLRTLCDLAGNLCSWPSGKAIQHTAVLGDEPRQPITTPRPSSRAPIPLCKLEYVLFLS